MPSSLRLQCTVVLYVHAESCNADSTVQDIMLKQRGTNLGILGLQGWQNFRQCLDVEER